MSQILKFVCGKLIFPASVCLLIAILSLTASAQQPTGTIAGVVTDASGAVVPGAGVIVVNKASRATIRVTTSHAGAYNVPTLLPGQYEVRVEAKNFKTSIVSLKVEVGRVTTADVRLEVGSLQETVRVDAEGIRVNPAQTSVEGIVTGAFIRDLPLNGRNFLDLGQLEPGVQVVPDSIINRGGFARLSVAGQTGLTTRVTVDGLDIHDEHAGSVGMNLSADSIQEFQVSRAMFDISTGLTGYGAVNIATKSGGNQLHGSGFFFWRDDKFAARIGQEDAPFDREQAGFSLGGPFMRDRIFWYVNFERNNQDAAVATNIPIFPQYSQTWPSPSDERMASARLDGNATRNIRLFSRFTHNWHTGVSGRSLGGLKLSPKDSSNNANQTAVGLDATFGRFAHSVRFGYTNTDKVSDFTTKIPGVPETVDPAGRPLAVLQAQAGGAQGGNAILIGAHPNSPLNISQDTFEVRYDGGFSFGRHALRWGGTFNIIRVNWFEIFLGHGPQANLRINQSSINNCGSNILCYPVASVMIGNGLGYFSEVPALGRPYGGIRNNRVHWYAGDTWRAHPRLTLNFGVRWVFEPGPSNSDLKRPAILDSFMPGLSQSDRNDWNNFASQLGIVWSPSASGKWVVRLGAGVFYDTSRLQNVIFSERANLIPVGITGVFATGLFRDPNTNRVIFDFQGRNWTPAQGGPALITPGVNWQGLPLGTSGLLDAVYAAQAAFRAAYQVALANFPAGPSNCEATRGCTVIGPNYETPYSFHFNVGFQRELRPGLVLSVDYVRNRGLHFLMRHNANRNGAADTLDVSRALAAMNAVHGPRGCASSAAGVDCAIAAGATLTMYVNAGLSSSNTASTSAPSNSAFPGINPNFNGITMLTTSGLSNYNALQINLRGRLPNWGRVLRNPHLVVSYALGRLEGTAEDQAIINTADRVTNDDPIGFRGPTSLDRKHILSLAALFTIPGEVQLNSLWKAFSALPQTITVPQAVGGGEIFFTDFNGDGNGQDVLPGTNRGSYNRSLGCGANDLNKAIDRFNSTQAGNLTPAGQALVDAGLFRRDQLVQLGAVSPSIARAPAGQVCLDSFLTTDIRISRPFKFKNERITIEPALEWFNLFNVSNYDLPDNKLSGSLDTTGGSLNGTTAANRPNRAGGTGSFVLGAPRAWQLALRVTF